MLKNVKQYRLGIMANNMNRRLVMAFLCGAVWLSATAAQAGGGWSVDLFYGGGGYHGHRGPHCHPGFYGAYYYPRPYYNYVYVAPPPVVYAPQPVVTVPLSQTAAPQAIQTASNSSSATVRANSAPAYVGAGVTVRNPASSGTHVSFVVDSRKEMELAPGEAMPMVEKGHYFVEFDRGGDFGTAKRTLTEGSYEFVATANGWDLQRTQSGDGEGSIPTPVVRRNTLPTR